MNLSVAEVDREASRSREQADRLSRVWEIPRGWRYWSSVNNSQVGLWYTLTAFAFFFFAGILALLIRIQLAVPTIIFCRRINTNQVFTMHGTVMMFLFAVPIFEAISILLIPRCSARARFAVSAVICL